MKTLYFTGSGNSLYLAKEIGGEVLSIPQMIKEGRYNFEDDAIGIVFPCYSSRPPKMVEEFLNKATFKAQYTFAIVTFAALPGNPLTVTDKHFDYTAAVKMGDAFRDDIFIINVAKAISPYHIEKNLHKVVDDIHRRVKHVRSITPIDIIQTAAFRPHHNACARGDRALRDFEVNEKCVRCGTCAKACPAGNIKIDDAGVHFSNNCQSCYACLNICPHDALHLKKREIKNAKYRHQGITAKEIIDSNCQI